MTDKQFPQVADDELMLTQMPHMNLYDDGDFISNILGEYTDKNYLEWEPIATKKVAEQPYQKNLQKSLQKPFEVPKSRRQPMTPDFKEPVDKINTRWFPSLICSSSSRRLSNFPLSPV